MNSAMLPLVGWLVAMSPSPTKVPESPTFEHDVRPILKAYCFDCHGESNKPKGGLDLRLRRLMVAGGKSGPALVEGKPDASELLIRVREGDMPPGEKKLSAAEIEVLSRWIAAGAKTARPEPESLTPGMIITEEDRNWWAFQPIRKLEPPVAKPSDRGRTAIDRWLLRDLTAKGQGFNPDAERRTLIRRVTLDLIGIPPTPEEVEAFVADQSPNAYEKVIDRLLDSPHYGERWGRHWLDIAGYADSEGYNEKDPIRPTAWKYRDYVIRSLNADKPFDAFVREQLAGDELVRPPYAELPPAELDKLIATGFLRMAADGSGNAGADQKEARNAVVGDTVRIISSALLGMTVGCAECHHHRYDPIPQEDFYRLRALLEPAYNPVAWIPPATRRVSLYTAKDKAEAAKLEAEAKKIEAERSKQQQQYIDATLEKEYAKLPEDIREVARKAKATPAPKQTAEQKKLLQQHPSLNVNPGSLYLYDKKAADHLKKLADEAAAIRAKKPAEEFIRALTEVPGKLPETRLFHRGDPDQPKDVVPPGALTVLDSVLPMQIVKQDGLTTSGRRLAFANWLTHPDNPLFARVIVNRVWLNHFGRGIVGSAGDFGRLGEKPTHPELLDWLADEFKETGYSWKKLHRLILTSTVYRQTSTYNPADPDNDLYGRFPVLRLDAEAIRDGMLAVAGTLNRELYGPPIPVMSDDVGQIILGMANRDGAGYKKGDEALPPEQLRRRSLYVQLRRTERLAVLDSFDWATTEPNCEVRIRSTVAPQSLFLMNNEFIISESAAFAERIRKEAGPDLGKQIDRAWLLAYGVLPTDAERDRARTFLAEQEGYFRDLAPQRSAGPNAGAPVKVKPKTDKNKQTKPEPTPADRALATFCQAVLMSNRFLYVD